jgi:multisubunit Na+/H+ antiporter MnhB subunit
VGGTVSSVVLFCVLAAYDHDEMNNKEIKEMRRKALGVVVCIIGYLSLAAAEYEL